MYLYIDNVCFKTLRFILVKLTNKPSFLKIFIKFCLFYYQVKFYSLKKFKVPFACKTS